MSTVLFVMGMNAKAYFGAAEASLGSLNEMSNIKDLKVAMEAGEADVTTRANSGWEATAPTLKTCSADFNMQWKPGDLAFEAIKDAFLAGGQIELALLTGAKDASGSEGPKGSFSITKFERNEQLKEAVMVDVTAKLAVFGEWVKI